MTVEIILLALATTIRPTSMAAVYALLSNEAPRRLMTLYVVTGLLFTVAFGVLVVWVVDGVHFGAGENRTKGTAEIIAGCVAIGFALVVRSGRLRAVSVDDSPAVQGRWDRLRGHSMTPRTAAIAGPATHIPGLFYLIALNLIVTSQPKVPTGLLDVLLYNAIWFAIPLGALAVCIVEPETARELVHGIERWTLANTRTLVWVGALFLGVLMIVKGALTV